MADSNLTPDTSSSYSLGEWQRYIDQDNYGDQIAHEAMDEYEEERNIWNYMELWEAQQQQQQPINDEPMEMNDEPLQVGGQLDPLPPLFDFELAPIVQRASNRLGVVEEVVQVHLQQHRVDDPSRYHLYEELISALGRAVNQLLRQHVDLNDRDRLYFSLGSNLLDHVYDGWGVTVGEWRSPDNRYRVARVFENLAHLLNSNEQFQMDDSFSLSLVIVRADPRGGGGKRKYTPGQTSATTLRDSKKYVLTIPDDGDNMCCAKALLLSWKHATLSKEDFDLRYRKRQRTKAPFQTEAYDLQQHAGIPFGTLCGASELTLFATVLPDFHIVVVDADRCYECYRYGDGPTPLGLFYYQGHYDTVVNIPSIFNKSYWCSHCLTGYNTQGQHACQVNKDHCPRCLQNGCPDYVEYRQHYGHHPLLSCRGCRRTFFGQSCYHHHRVKTSQGQKRLRPRAHGMQDRVSMSDLLQAREFEQSRQVSRS